MEWSWYTFDHPNFVIWVSRVGGYVPKVLFTSIRYGWVNGSQRSVTSMGAQCVVVNPCSSQVPPGFSQKFYPPSVLCASYNSRFLSRKPLSAKLATLPIPEALPAFPFTVTTSATKPIIPLICRILQTHAYNCTSRLPFYFWYLI